VVQTVPELAVGRHAADSAGRPSGQGPRDVGVEGGVGWPGPPNPPGRRLGWPADATGEADGGAEADGEPAPSGLAA
jgi:hypothetical protein